MTVAINPNRIDLDEAYMQMAEVWAKRSKANRLQVGALLVKDRRIISDGYNGMPAGSTDELCEVATADGKLVTKREVLHAESNVLLKLAEQGGTGAQGATLYTTWSPCFDCSKLIRQAKIKRVVFRNAYRDMDGVQFLHDSGVEVMQLAGGTTMAPGPAPVRPVPPPGRLEPESSAPPKPPSMIQSVAAGNGEFSRLRAQMQPPPAPTPVLAQSPDQVIIGKTEFTPVVSEDEVAALLRQHEAMTSKPAAAKTAEQPPGEGSYTSSFI